MLSRLSACNDFLYWKLKKTFCHCYFDTYGKEVICLQLSTPRLSNVPLDHRDEFLMRTFQRFQLDSIPLWLGCGLYENYENLSVINHYLSMINWIIDDYLSMINEILNQYQSMINKIINHYLSMINEIINHYLSMKN